MIRKQKVYFNGYASRAAALRAVNARIDEINHAHDKDFPNVSSVLGDPESNVKVKKSIGEHQVFTYTHNLTPSDYSGILNVCPWASDGCRKACLHTAGNPAFMPMKERGRLARTAAFKFAREAYIAALMHDIRNTAYKHLSRREKIAVRLNTTSDIPWENLNVWVGDSAESESLHSVISAGALFGVEFYDYTKSVNRALNAANDSAWPSNYRLTFSASEDTSEIDIRRLMELNVTVAVVVRAKRSEKLPSRGTVDNGTFPIIDMDKSDYRPSDAPGCLGLLRAKGEALQDRSGFVWDRDDSLNFFPGNA